jgi:hypothetical protein
MSLALVTIEPSDFDLIHGHIISHKPPHRNMHMREACQRQGERDLRYLHAMFAPPGKKIVEGMISGPGLLWVYRIVQTKSRTQLDVLREPQDLKARERIGRRFLTEIRKRIQDEKTGDLFPPRRTPGQYYLKRNRRGTPATHPNCRRAVDEEVLAPLFVSRLEAWGFELLRP